MIVSSKLDAMPRFDLVAGDRVGGPGLDGAERAPLDARNLHEPGDRIAGHAQMMLQRRLRGVLDDPGVRIVAVAISAAAIADATPISA